MRKVLTDPEVTTVRIVLNLEKMVVKEAKRAYTYLSLFGYVTDAVIVNRLLPGELRDELFQKWQRIHQRYQLEVEQSFAGIPIFNVPLFDSEVVGRRCCFAWLVPSTETTIRPGISRPRTRST
jgi:arsenite-transporting ATPase